jgi:hypothetical protein
VSVNGLTFDRLKNDSMQQLDPLNFTGPDRSLPPLKKNQTVEKSRKVLLFETHKATPELNLCPFGLDVGPNRSPSKNLTLCPKVSGKVSENCDGNPSYMANDSDGGSTFKSSEKFSLDDGEVQFGRPERRQARFKTTVVKKPEGKLNR